MCAWVRELQFPPHRSTKSLSSLEDDNGGDEEWSGDKLHGVHDAVRSDVPGFQRGEAPADMFTSGMAENMEEDR